MCTQQPADEPAPRCETTGTQPRPPCALALRRSLRICTYLHCDAVVLLPRSLRLALQPQPAEASEARATRAEIRAGATEPAGDGLLDELGEEPHEGPKADENEDEELDGSLDLSRGDGVA
eukprot:4914261-Prymnesium_polylepis.1